ncbi:hypothetical protein AA2016_2290 [Aminobacter aminovorans]|uniref:Uncharacterized protein n=1 Tax=Aminobacter aminovorans TaxID=83263 RepID=A0AAC9AQZ6_AMIAI|nr:hypothetical protein AA2016_2290 [Aminobacter aminovorans]
MADQPSPVIQGVAEIVADHMDAILRCFKPGAKITVLVRHPDTPDGRKDFVLSDDDLALAVVAIQQRLDPANPTIRGEV